MKKCYYFFICLLAFLFVGCESNEDIDPVSSEITIPSQFSTIELDSDDLSQTITFIATTDWAITMSETTKATPDWIKVSPMSGSAGSVTLSITLDENEGSEDRSTDLIITISSGEERISITQAAFGPILSLDLTSKSVTCVSDSFNVAVTSNIDWQTSDIPDWITLTSTSGSGDQTITFSYTENTATQSRNATIKFSNATYSKEAEIVVTQVAPQLSDLTDGGSLY